MGWPTYTCKTERKVRKEDSANPNTKPNARIYNYKQSFVYAFPFCWHWIFLPVLITPRTHFSGLVFVLFERHYCILDVWIPQVGVRYGNAVQCASFLGSVTRHARLTATQSVSPSHVSCECAILSTTYRTGAWCDKVYAMVSDLLDRNCEMQTFDSRIVSLLYAHVFAVAPDLMWTFLWAFGVEYPDKTSISLLVPRNCELQTVAAEAASMEYAHVLAVPPDLTWRFPWAERSWVSGQNVKINACSCPHVGGGCLWSCTSKCAQLALVMQQNKLLLLNPFLTNGFSPLELNGLS